MAVGHAKGERDRVAWPTANRIQDFRARYDSRSISYIGQTRFIHVIE
ncbi:hypothetical protein [Moorena sp. SIO4A5]|nr:hypothetical protein [Moorena sp. SIO4A5]NEO24387.1 hypothetical protein [Moorena sp. SIO4A5]